MEKPQELIDTEKRIAEQETTINLMREATQNLVGLVRDLKVAEERLNTNTELLRQSNEDIHVLLAFIKSKGLQPPKIQSKFTN